MSRSFRGRRAGKVMCGAAVWAAGMAGAVWGQTQAIVPLDVSGQTPTAPAAQGPGAPAVAPAERAAGGTAAVAAPAAPTPGAAFQGGPSGSPATQAIIPADAGTAPSAVTLPAATPNIPTAATPAPGNPTVPAPAAAAPAAVTQPIDAAASAPAPAATATAGGAVIAPPPATATAAPAPEIPTGKALPRDGNGYPVTEIKIGYKFPHPALPAISDLLNSQIKLGEVDDGYVALRAGVRAVTIKLGDIGKSGEKKIYRSGIAAIYGHILRYLNDRNIIGVFVVVDPEDIKTAPGDTVEVDKDVDVRKDRTSLQFVIVTSTVKQVRAVEVGDISTPNRVNDPRFDYIRNNSPLQPAAEGQAHRNDLLRKDVLDDYRLRLNRVQGRRVDVAISGTNEAGEVYLDYLIAQARPWYVYTQLSNTGTSQTSDWRERFGFVDSQLTGHDDVLSVDYMTSGFSTSQGLVGSYEFPVFNLDRLRDRVYGSWNDFTASDVGQAKGSFKGSSWLGGEELIFNFFQKRELFVDAVVGARMQNVTSTPTGTFSGGTPGRGMFYEPYIGLKLERSTDVASTTGDLTLTRFFTSSNENDITGLGRINPTSNPTTLQYDFLQTFYLEPLVDPQRFASGSSTLAHEIAISLKGQWAFNERLFPQAQDVAGGLFSVRGYPESIVAGDSVVIGSAEYRFHLPRVFAVMDDPTKTPFLWDKAFRYAPQQAYGRPDWDLIMRAFFDVAEVVNSSRNKSVHEMDNTLMGVGLGLELQFKQNFNLRIDWGVPLTNIKDPTGGNKNEVEEGSSRFHISTTFLY